MSHIKSGPLISQNCYNSIKNMSDLSKILHTGIRALKHINKNLHITLQKHRTTFKKN